MNFMKKSIFPILCVIIIILSGCAPTFDDTPFAPGPIDDVRTEDTASDGNFGVGIATDANDTANFTFTDFSNADADKLVETVVTRVVDGDTLKVLLDGEEETIRLLLVDTPETVHPSKPEQPFGKDASNYVKEMLENEEIVIEFDKSLYDNYNRYLGYIWFDGQMVNEMLVAEGLARVAYIYPPNTKYVEQLQEAENVARKNKKNIWSIDGYVESEFELEMATSPSEMNEETFVDASCENPTIKGNINSKGEKIYHMPGGQYYDVTIAEAMFCNEQEAADAGFRASKR